MHERRAAAGGGSRWTWLLVLTLLVGGLLLMHGLDVHAGVLPPPTGAEATAHVAEGTHADGTAHAADGHDHDHRGPQPTDHGHCADCVAGHVMAACVAIITAVGGIGLARRLAGRRPLVAAPVVLARLRGTLGSVLPPGPRLASSVLRC